MPPRIAIGTSHRRTPERWARRLGRPRGVTLRTIFDKVPALNKEPIVSVTLEDRAKALEDQFFEKENQKKLEAMRSQEAAKTTREELRKASGMTDEKVLDRLIALGLKTNTIAALSLVPLQA